MQHHLRVELASQELLAIELPSAVEVRAVSGYHWLTVDGLDVYLAPGERETVPAGKILAEGLGQLEFSPSSALSAHGAEDRAAQGTMLLGKVCF
ncbi:hypothetical protein NH8B_0909 [Pseudogulbenkiania sp. NH8B]|uniref:hypothetical protein n=1 Tax=Pseudogulbenkiania sp. (strain NH8B) TaxID=748280 RepID=UPI00022799F6|nr:hypothetical protein [Pseudogulbenkiania sp. NH8B]BAK75741.1 hypothetical protein NH8B_0909 [Pseudogulbenkiania sp. NH8B]